MSRACKLMHVWETGAELKIPLALLIGGADKAESLAALTRAMKIMPELQLILDHMGDYSPPEDAMQSIDPALLNAADVPNLFIKVSTHNLKRLTANGGSARKGIKPLVDAFTAKRIIWGSDIGNSRVSYPEMISMAKDAFAELSPADQAMILSGTAKTLYRRA